MQIVHLTVASFFFIRSMDFLPAAFKLFPVSYFHAIKRSKISQTALF